MAKYRRTGAELEQVDQAIIEAVTANRPVTVRGVFYRVVSAGGVEKTEHGYDLVIRRLKVLRRAGKVSYWDITDGTRTTFRPRTYTGIDQVLSSTAEVYRRQLWADQGTEVMIFSEKDAITGVLYPVTSEYDVPLSVVRGYSSETMVFTTADLVNDAAMAGKHVIIYQLGDHDPSGVDAWRSFTEQVVSFLPLAEQDDDGWRFTAVEVLTALSARNMQAYAEEAARLAAEGHQGIPGRPAHLVTRDGGRVTFARLAVTPEQITSMSLPTRPTKQTDTRAARFAGESVEVDAIPPAVLRQVVRDAIERHIDQDALRLTREAEASEREVLGRMAADSDWLVREFAD